MMRMLNMALLYKHIREKRQNYIHVRTQDTQQTVHYLTVHVVPVKHFLLHSQNHIFGKLHVTDPSL